MYKFKLQIDGNDRKLSNEDGISLKDLTELLSKLIKCLGSKASVVTLTDIENSSYTPTIKTLDDIAIDRLNDIHQTISSVNIKKLPKEEKEYAAALNRILFERGLHITLLNSKDEREIKLSGLTTKDVKTHYVSITSVTGQIQGLYGKVENKPHIFVRTANGFEYYIYVTQEQELKLSPYYKNTNIRFRIRSKIDLVSGVTLQSNLIDFAVLSENNLYTTIKHIKAEFGDIFQHIEDSATILQNLRNN